MKTLITLTFIAFSGLLNAQTLPSPEKMLEEFTNAVKTYPQLEYDYYSKERFPGGKYKENEGHFKVWEGVQKKVIAFLRSPTKTILLWRQGEFDNKINIDVPIIGWKYWALTHSQFLSKSHHTVDHSGYSLPLSTMTKIYKEHKEDLKDAYKLNGIIKYDNKDCYDITITNKKYDGSTIDYKVKVGENLMIIAHREAINERQIMELNSDIDNYFDITAGQVIKIPKDFGSKIQVYADIKTKLPIFFAIYDGKGLLGEYHYTNLDTNPQFKESEFVRETVND